MNDDLTEPEERRIFHAYRQWRHWLSAKNYRHADRYRKALTSMGCMGPDLAKWHAVFESSVCRTARLRRRQPPPTPVTRHHESQL